MSRSLVRILFHSPSQRQEPTLKGALQCYTALDGNGTKAPEHSDLLKDFSEKHVFEGSSMPIQLLIPP